MSCERGRIKRLLWAVLLVQLSVGCAGTKVLKEPLPVALTQALASHGDESLHVKLDWVIVRDGPGSWAKNVDWDEYLLRVTNLSSAPITITGVALIDSQGTSLVTSPDRSELVHASKLAARRYKSAHIEIRAGMGAGELVLSAAGAGIAAPALALSAYAGGGGAVAAAGAVGLVVLAPVLAAGGIYRLINNHNVQEQLTLRQTGLPITLAPATELAVDLFFPLAPSPLRVEIQYEMDGSRELLLLDTENGLQGLHLVESP